MRPTTLSLRGRCDSFKTSVSLAQSCISLRAFRILSTTSGHRSGKVVRVKRPRGIRGAGDIPQRPPTRAPSNPITYGPNRTLTLADSQPFQNEGSATEFQAESQHDSTSTKDGSEQVHTQGSGLSETAYPTTDSPNVPKSEKLRGEALVRAIQGFDFDAPIPSNVVRPMVNAIQGARASGLPDIGPGYAAETQWAPAPPQRPLNTTIMQRQSPIMMQDLQYKRRTRKWIEHLNTRKDLPVMAEGRHHKLYKLLQDCDVLIVPGSTGSGKSTQVPQIILDYAIHDGKGGYANIICSQPRRISAVSVARRVAEERTESLGQTVGYHVRFSDSLPKRYGGILYCTGGILWNYLHHRPNDVLENTSHILIDEVHERSIEIDLILMILRKLIHERRAQGLKYPKVLLMSATLNSEDFERYFSESVDGQPGLRVQTFEIPGRLFPITETYLDDLLPSLQSSRVRAVEPLMNSHDTKTYVKQEITEPGAATEEQISRDSYVPAELVTAATLQIFSSTANEGGDILVFLPGLADIDKTWSLLEANRGTLENHPECTGVSIFKLHSSLSETNDLVFDEVPQGWRRIVLASNIAETSVTLSGVTHVIDTGSMKLSVQASENGLRDLRCRWASKQSVQQRRGRAGRIRPGNYYALYSRARLDMFDEHVTPEIQRTDLTSSALSLKTMAKPVNIGEGLCHVPDQPVLEEINSAIRKLERMGALTENEEVTPLGRTLSLFAANPAAGKALLLGVLFRCLEPMLVAAVTEDEPIDGQTTEGTAVLRSRYMFSEGSGSNSIATYNAFKELRAAIASGDIRQEEKLATERGLRRSMFHFISRSARQICKQLHESGFADIPDTGDDGFPVIPPKLNDNADCQPLIKALLMLSTQPEIAVRWSKHTFYGGGNDLLMPQFRSVNDNVSYLVHREQIGTRIPARGDLVAYAHGRTVSDNQRHTMVATSSVTPLMAILFARTADRVSDTQVKLNNAINLKLTALNDSPKLTLTQVLTLVLEFRKTLNRFVQVAFSDLHPGRRWHEKPPDCNKMFAADHELRDKVTAGLVEILKLDAAVESTVLAERYVKWEEADDRRLREVEKAQAARRLAKIGLQDARQAAPGQGQQVSMPDTVQAKVTEPFLDGEDEVQGQAAAG